MATQMMSYAQAWQMVFGALDVEGAAQEIRKQGCTVAEYLDGVWREARAQCPNDERCEVIDTARATYGPRVEREVGEAEDNGKKRHVAFEDEQLTFDRAVMRAIEVHCAGLVGGLARAVADVNAGKDVDVACGLGGTWGGLPLGCTAAHAEEATRAFVRNAAAAAGLAKA